MLKNESNKAGECFITQQQFNIYRSQIAREFQALRAILDSQRLQIQLIKGGKETGKEELGKIAWKSQEVEQENRELKRKIGELQTTIEEYERKNKELAGNQTTSLGQDLEKEEEKLELQETTSKLVLSSQFYPDSVEEKTGNNDISKFLLDMRLTKQTQEELQQDDDEEIECIWQDSDSKNLKTIILNNENHLHNPHIKEFSIVNIYGKVSITKVSGSGFLCPAHSFIYKDSLPMGKIGKFCVKAIKLRDLFMIGVGTINTFGVDNAFRHKESLVYSSKGDLWSNGDSLTSGRSIRTGQQMHMIVDRKQDIVHWTMNGVQIARAQIPACMLNKEMYMILIMFNRDDNVQLCKME